MQEKNEYFLSKQLLRSSASIGANITEGQYAQSGPDFHTKMSIAKKEAAESLYWIRLLMSSGLVPKERIADLHDDCEELVKMLVSICKTTYKRNFGTFLMTPTFFNSSLIIHKSSLYDSKTYSD